MFVVISSALPPPQFSNEIINALFGYGSFTKENIEMTSQALKYFGYGIPAFALIKVLANFFFARNNTKTPFYLSAFIVFLNITISLFFFICSISSNGNLWSRYLNNRGSKR